MNILTPTVLGDRIFTSAHSGRSELWDLSRTASGGWEIDRLWEAKHQAYMASPVLLGDYLYMHLRNTRFTCIDMKTGEAAWITRPVGDYWSMVASDDRILSLSSDGVLRLIEPTPEEYREVDQLGVADDSWAHLAVAGNLVFVRDLEKLKVYRFQE
jgi:outer membrane protein assembly factor BamB